MRGRPAANTVTTSLTWLLVAGLVIVTSPKPAVAADKGHAPASFAFATVGSATPVEVDIYEPFIPIPATPQAEFELGYSKVLADSTSSRARASFLWPGDAVGEGLKVILQTAGLPGQDYPIQVNASYPSSSTSQTQQPAPGATMSATALSSGADAQSSISSTCAAPSTWATQPRPDSALALRPPPSGTTIAGVSPSDTPCQIPTSLGGLVQVAGGISHSTVASSSAPIMTRAVASASEVSILDGLITLSDVRGAATTRADGAAPTGTASSTYSALSVEGSTVAIGSNGLILPGHVINVPGLPADPNDALKLLGITLSLPQPLRHTGGHAATAAAAALVVTIDTSVLRSHLDPLPWSSVEDAVNQLPDSLRQLKGLLIGAMLISPRIVITIGKVSAGIATADSLSFPPLTGGFSLGLPGGAATASSGPSTGVQLRTGASGPAGASIPAEQTGAQPLFAPTSGQAPPPLPSTPGGLVVLLIAAAAGVAALGRRAGLAGLIGPAATTLPDLRRA